MATKKANIIALIVLALVGFLLFRQETSPSVNETVEAKLAATLSKIEGVGQVSVYVHTEASRGESSLFSFSTAESADAYTGVLIVSEGASSPLIRRKLKETVSAILQLPAHRIVILPMEEGEGGSS